MVCLRILRHTRLDKILKEKYINGTSWYRVYSDGWIEQGGLAESGDGKVVTLLKSFKNTNYTVLLTAYQTRSLGLYTPLASATSASTFTMYGTGVAGSQKYWYACGY